MTTLFDKIKEVTELSATSGFEAPVRDYLRKNITPLVDESKQMVSVVFSVSSIAKQKMPLRCLWLPTWMKLAL